MKRRSQGKEEVPINEVASKLIDVKIKKEELEAQEKALKAVLMEHLETGGSIDTDGYKISKIRTVTPVVSVAAASSVLEMHDFMQVVKVSITELREKMGEEKIHSIADTFDIKEYISVKKKK